MTEKIIRKLLRKIFKNLGEWKLVPGLFLEPTKNKNVKYSNYNQVFKIFNSESKLSITNGEESDTVM